MAYAYYNENDPYAAQWLRNLIKKGLIYDGYVDEKSIKDVDPDTLGGFSQYHFFAGIGGWAHAARLARWPDELVLVTGSCPCQPFSVAGKGRGSDDERHLWPDFNRIIQSIGAPVIMGEQVSGKAGYAWFDGVSSDLEGQGYTTGAVDIPACSVNAPHLRSRLYWVAHTDDARSQGRVSGWQDSQREDQQRHAGRDGPTHGSVGMADAGGHWGQLEWVTGSDGKFRRFEPSIQLLAHGVPARVGKLRAFGNAIVPQVAAQVMSAFLESVN